MSATPIALESLQVSERGSVLSTFLPERRKGMENEAPSRALLSGLRGGEDSHHLQECKKRSFTFFPPWNKVWFVHSTYIFKKKRNRGIPLYKHKKELGLFDFEEGETTGGQLTGGGF